jgi:hypothetical protein
MVPELHDVDMAFRMIVFLILGPGLNLPAQNWEWAMKASSTTSTQNEQQISVDSAGNVYALCINKGLATYNTTIIYPGTALIKYNKSGSLQWAKNLNFTPRHIATDNSSNIYLACTYFNTVSTASATFASVGDADLLLVKLNSSGTELWAHSYGGPSGDNLVDIAVDRRGNTYLTGWYRSDTISFNNYCVIDSVSDGTYFLAKVNTYGLTGWVDRGVQDSLNLRFDCGLELAIDKFDRPYVLGAGMYSKYPHAFVAKYEPFGTRLFNNWKWVWGYTQYFENLEIDDSLNIYICSGGGNHPDHGTLAKYDSALNFKWSFYLGPQYGCWGFGSPRVAGNGQCYLSGFVAKSPYSFECSSSARDTVYISGIPVHFRGEGDFVVGLLNQGGKLEWIKTAGGDGLEFGSYPVIGQNNHYYVSGRYNISVTSASNNYSTQFDQTVLPNDGTWQQMFVAKLGEGPELLAINTESEEPIQIQVFPNPSTGVFNFILNEKSTITVTNLIGTEIYSQQSIEKSGIIDLRRSPKGIYFFRIINSSGAHLRKLVIE